MEDAMGANRKGQEKEKNLQDLEIEYMARVKVSLKTKEPIVFSTGLVQQPKCGKM